MTSMTDKGDQMGQRRDFDHLFDLSGGRLCSAVSHLVNRLGGHTVPRADYPEITYVQFPEATGFGFLVEGTAVRPAILCRTFGEAVDVHIKDKVFAAHVGARGVPAIPPAAPLGAATAPPPNPVPLPEVYRPDGQHNHAPESLFVGLLAMTGDDPYREGLLETPKRVEKAFKQWFGGYSVDVPALLKVFEDGAQGSDQMVIVKDIPIYSKCEHHMADIFGTATIAYIPNGKIVGLSKLSRVADAFARRLQVQERLTNQIADAINDNLGPLGVGVVIKARHMCMESRGICQQGHHTITSALRGVIKDEPDTRAEFFSFVNSK